MLRHADEKLKGSVDGLYRMADALDSCEDYDYIIIDTAPSMNSILHNCLIVVTARKIFPKGKVVSDWQTLIKSSALSIALQII